MPSQFSTNFNRNANAISGGAYPIVLLEIDHPDLTEPARACSDSQDITSNGNLFVALPFRISLPDDLESGLPKAALAIDNVGKILTTWIEQSGGGKGATCRIMVVMRDTPDNLESDVTLDMTGIYMDNYQLSATLGYTDIMNQAAITMTYRPDTTPGLY